MPSTMKKRTRSAPIMMRLRLMRSLSDAGGGGGEGAGEHLQDHGEADGLGLAAGEIEQQIVDGEGVEPVAQLADDLGEPEEAVVAVAAKEREVGGEHAVARYVYRPMRCFTVRTVLLAMGATRSAPSRSTPAR